MKKNENPDKLPMGKFLAWKTRDISAGTMNVLSLIHIQMCIRDRYEAERTVVELCDAEGKPYAVIELKDQLLKVKQIIEKSKKKFSGKKSTTIRPAIMQARIGI